MALIVAFVFTTQVSPLVFPNNTPSVRPQLGTYLALKLKNIGNSGEQFLASIFKRVDTTTSTTTIASYQEELKSKQDKLSDVAFQQLSKGVYAKDEGSTHSLVEVKIDEIEFIEHTFIVNGKTIIIKVPKDQQLPSQKVLEQIYGN